MFPHKLFSLPVIVAIAGAYLLHAPSASAGFEWTPDPAQAETAPADDQKPPMAAPGVESAPLAPIGSPDMIHMEPLQSDPPTLRHKTVTPAAEMPAEPDMEKAKAMIEAQKRGEQKAPQPDSSRILSAPVIHPEPLKQPAPPSAAIVQPPAQPVMAAPSAPIVTAPMADPKTATSGKVVINPYPLGNAPQPSPASVPQQQEMPAQYEEAVGFGSDMPLALALRQVVPPQYAFSFGAGVNPGYRVSWNGGKPWDQVVREMVAPLNLQADIRGNTVRIYPAGSVSSLPPSIEPPKPTVISMGGEDLPPGQPRRQKPQEAASAPAPVVIEDSPPPQIAVAAPNSFDRVEAAAQRAEGVRIPIPVETFQADSQPRIWEAKEGDSLKATLDQWSAMANVDLEWKASRDYALASNVMVNGTYGNAVKVLMTHSVLDNDKPKFNLVNNDSGVTTGIVIEDRTS